MTTRLYIPALGDTIKLAEPWSFTLHEEHRNIKLINLIDPSYKDGTVWHGMRMDYYRRQTRLTWPVTLPSGTELVVDRIYIRAGVEDFNSLTFRTKMGKKSIRFWAKLADVNKIVMV